jgi:hypothetical protein
MVHRELQLAHLLLYPLKQVGTFTGENPSLTDVSSQPDQEQKVTECRRKNQGS